MGLRRIYLYGFILYFLSTATGLLAQEGKIRFERVNLEDGLIQGHIFDIEQDSLGFIWFATGGGLTRYDGYSFKSYFYDKLDSLTITSDWIFSIARQGNDYLWVSGNGVSRLNLKTGKSERFQYNKQNKRGLGDNRVYDIYTDKNNDVWISHGKGVDRFREFDKTFEHITIENYKLDRHSSKIFESSDGTLWLTSGSGIYAIDKVNLTYKHYLFPETNDWPLAIQVTFSCIELPDGTLWIGTDNGIWMYNPSKDKFEQVKELLELKGTAIRTFLLDRDQETLWIGTSSVGLIRYSLKNQQVLHRYTYDPTELSGINNNNIYTLFQDRWHNIWVGTFNGINFFNYSSKKFPFYQNESGIDNFANYSLKVFQDSKGRIVSNTMEGLFVIEPGQLKGRRIFHENLIPPGRFSPVGSMCEYQGKLWMLLRGVGLIRGDLDSGKSEVIRGMDFFDQSTLFALKYYPRYKDYFWITTSNGLVKYHIASKTAQWFTFNYLPEGLNKSSVSMTDIDNEGKLWMTGLEGHVICFDPVTEAYRSYSVTEESGVQFRGIGITSAGIFVASNAGLFQIMVQGNDYVIKLYDKYSGLRQTDLSALEVGNHEEVWISALNYIIEFQPNTGQFSHYSIAHHLKETTTFANYKTPSGRLLFGGTNGLISFDPLLVQRDSTPPVPVIIDIKVLNESIQSKLNPEFLKDLYLTYRDKVFSISYAGLQLIHSKENVYRYKLEGFDKDWQYVGIKRDVTYTNLNPGKYIFKLQAANADGVWSDEEVELAIFISPPYWQTTWFYALICILSLGIIYAFVDNRNRNRRLAQEKQIAEQSARYKSMFLANMSHEIRTPMNAILGMSKLMFDTALSDKQLQYAKAIRESAENLLVIINDILDHSKIESGKYTFVNRPFDTNLIINQIDTLFRSKAEEKGIVFSIEIDPQIPATLIGDPIRLNQILINLVSNAVKFTHKGFIKVIVKRDNTYETGEKIGLIFEVIDSGTGIPDDAHDHIFESFQQADNNELPGNMGTGLGLAIVKQLVNQQGGTIQFTSKVDQGSHFTIKIPFVVNNLQDQVVTDILPSFPNEIKFQILLVEDTLFNQLLAVEVIKKYFPNAIIDVADNGAIAVEKAASKSYDIILMDVKMPVMDGYEATRQIRLLRQYAFVPILGLTANAIPEQLIKCKEVGMDDVITKPIDGQDLAVKLVHFIKLNT
jgi:signal transduction histidine kinase/CheY-like chemotaxis protein/streptogramin lyase